MDDNTANTMTATDFDDLIANNPPEGTVTTNAPATDGASTPAQTEGSTGDNPAATQTTEGTPGDTQGAAQSTTQTEVPISNQAFAQMRVNNRKTQEALRAVLSQHGLDPNLAANPDQLIKEANDARLEAEAKKQHVPTELLQRLTQLENDQIERERERLATSALSQFKQLQTKYNLTQSDISAFARQLQEAGTNPFETDMDLEQHYKLHNLDKIIQAETTKAVEAALKNQTAAQQHSTTPQGVNGKENTGTEQIDTMAKFDAFINTLNK